LQGPGKPTNGQIGETALNKVCSIFSQILALADRTAFDRSVKEHKGERHARGRTCWGQFVAMLFCQLGRAHSLREICQGLAACEGKLKHLGVAEPPRVSSLSYMNQHRPWKIYQEQFYALQARCEQESKPGHRFRFRNKLVSMDSTTIGLCVSMFDWAHFQRAKGAVKIHLILDHDGYLPHFALVTDGKKHDITVARALQWDAGTIVVIDKGYADYAWWKRLDEQGVFFVTRLRKDAKLEEGESREVPEMHRERIRSDQDITLLGGRKQLGKDGLKVRRIVVWDEERQEEFVFVTNHRRLAASTIDRIYRDRWQIETFFKSLKQLLKIKTFVGTSENAVLTQIWTALITMLLLRWLRLKARYNWSLSNLVALLRQQLFVHRDLFAWLNDPFTGPPESPLIAPQLVLNLG
jgi:Transposase DDE domain/Domain of unknown function (DUF4372)